MIRSFFGTIKLARLCRFNQRLLLFIRTLQHALKDLMLFTFMFSFVYMAFIALFYLIFNSTLRSCSTIFRTAQMLFEFVLMNFDAQEIISAAAFLGPFCFSLFIFLVVFVCMSMFLTIINDNFRFARNHSQFHDDDHIFSFMFHKFQSWIGLSNEDEFKTDRHKYFDPIENFPDKIDQFLDVLNRVSFDLNEFSFRNIFLLYIF